MNQSKPQPATRSNAADQGQRSGSRGSRVDGALTCQWIAVFDDEPAATAEPATAA